MKKLISILLVAMLVVTCLATIAFAAGSATLTVSSASAQAGDEVTISFSVSGAPFAGYGLKIKTSSALQLTSITKGVASEGGFVSKVETGFVTGAATYNTAAGELFTATFKVAEDAKPGKYAINVEIDEFFNENLDDLDITISKGYITVICVHEWSEWEEVEAPTCKATGKEARTCAKCGEVEERELDKTQHNWSAWTQVEAPTCNKVGKEERVCSICGDKETREVGKAAHSWGAWTQVQAPTCSKAGKEERVCSVCGEKETREVAKTQHNWGAWTVVTEATCSKAGKEERVCSICGEKETREIAKLAHSWSAWTVVTEATCSKAGKEERTCSVCGEKETREIAKTQHNWGAWTVVKEATCSKAGKEERVCSICKEKETREIPTTEHNWGEWTVVQEATCSAVGKEERVCSICKEKEEREIAKTEHTFGEWTVVEAATCQAAGKEEAVCSVCGEKQEREIAKLDHTPSVGYAYDDENHWHVCTVCNEALTKEAHDLEWVVTKEADKETTGLKHQECKVCDYCGDDVVIPEYETGDFTLVIAFGALALLAGLALAAYLLKRKFKW